jgi:hypothetical protein
VLSAVVSRATAVSAPAIPLDSVPKPITFKPLVANAVPGDNSKITEYRAIPCATLFDAVVRWIETGKFRIPANRDPHPGIGPNRRSTADTCQFPPYPELPCIMVISITP